MNAMQQLPDLTVRAPGPADDLVTTHDGARELLSYALTGARVTLHRVAVPGSAEAAARTRRINQRNALRNADAACDELAQRVADLELQRATAQANVLALTCAVHDAAAADVRDAVVLRGDLLQRFNWN
jgi:hypothetical protein